MTELPPPSATSARRNDLGHHHIEWAHRDGTTIATLSGEIDVATAADTFSAVRRDIDGEDGIIIDLTAVRFMDSTALRELVQLAGEWSIKVVAPRGAEPRKVLAITALDTVIATFETVQAAVAYH